MVLFSLRRNKPQKLAHTQKESAYETKSRSNIRRKSALLSAGICSLLLVPVLVAAFSDGGERTFSEKSENGSDIRIDTDVSAKKQAEADISIQTRAGGNTQSQQPASTEVQVNGQDIPVPENGRVHETVDGSGNQSTVTIDVNSQTSSSSDEDDGSSRIRIRSSSDSDIRIRSSH